MGKNASFSRKIKKNLKNFKKNFKKQLTSLNIYVIIVLVNGGLAQLVEYLPYKQWVIGSSPIVPTIKIPHK